MTKLWEAMGGGYVELTGSGQYLALFFIAMLGFAFYKEKKEKIYWYYSLAMTLLLLVPVTAWALLKYQTRFYAYGNLWALVPLTGMTACGGVLLTELARKQCRESRLFGHKKYGGALLTGLFCLVIFMAGSMTLAPVNRDETVNAQKIPGQQAQVLEWICGNVKEPRLWAPAGVLEYARAYSGEIRLVYGRNMWELSLNGNTYDQYSEQAQEMYEQMESYASTGQWEEAVLETAAQQGCSVMVLPKWNGKEWNPGEQMGEHFVCQTQTDSYVIFTNGILGKVE